MGRFFSKISVNGKRRLKMMYFSAFLHVDPTDGISLAIGGRPTTHYNNKVHRPPKGTRDYINLRPRRRRRRRRRRKDLAWTRDQLHGILCTLIRFVPSRVKPTNQVGRMAFCSNTNAILSLISVTGTIKIYQPPNCYS